MDVSGRGSGRLERTLGWKFRRKRASNVLPITSAELLVPGDPMSTRIPFRLPQGRKHAKILECRNDGIAFYFRGLSLGKIRSAVHVIHVTDS